MADYMAAHITIGGAVSPNLAQKLCIAIAKEGLALEWSEATFQPRSVQELLEVRCKVGGHYVLQLFDDEAPYGQFAQLEEFLVRHRIPFDRKSEGKYEFDPVAVFYWPPRDPVVLLATTSGRVVTYAAPLWSLAAKFSAIKVTDSATAAGSLRSLIRQLHRALPPQPPPLPELECSRHPTDLKAARIHHQSPSNK